MTEIISCSIPDDLKNFLAENPDLSPSKIIQNVLYTMKEQRNSVEIKIKAYQIRNEALSSKLQKVLFWCEENKVIIPDNVLA